MRIIMLGVNNRREHIGEDFKLVCNPNVVPIRRNTIRDDTLAHLIIDEWFNHGLFTGHFANPGIRFKSHFSLFLGLSKKNRSIPFPLHFVTIAGFYNANIPFLFSRKINYLNWSALSVLVSGFVPIDRLC